MLTIRIFKKTISYISLRKRQHEIKSQSVPPTILENIIQHSLHKASDDISCLFCIVARPLDYFLSFRDFKSPGTFNLSIHRSGPDCCDSTNRNIYYHHKKLLLKQSFKGNA